MSSKILWIIAALVAVAIVGGIRWHTSRDQLVMTLSLNYAVEADGADRRDLLLDCYKSGAVKWRLGAPIPQNTENKKE